MNDGEAANDGGQVRYHRIDGRAIALRHLAGREPTLLFLPGYLSDMTGNKATALLAWARACGQACLLLDCSGCGASEGSFAQGTLARWRDEAVGVIEAHAPGPVLVVGSSLGGWLMLLVALAIPPERLAAGETVLEDNPYGAEPTPTHAGFWRDGQRRLLLGDTIAIDAPVRLLHGQQDRVVPWQLALRLAAALRSADVQVTLIKDGDHRLSREADIAVLLRIVANLVDETAPATAATGPPR